MEDPLQQFLLNRGICKATLDYLKQENIDITSLQVMEEEKLKEIFPRYGDRLAVMDFCRRSIAPKKHSLIERLREKIRRKNSQNSGEDAGDEKQEGRIKEYGKKATRIIELGWLCSREQDGKLVQVRTKHGGGTRRITVQKSMRMDEVLEEAKKLFFPYGRSGTRFLHHYEVTLCDFKENPLDTLSYTCEEIFALTALTKLRFYLCTIRKRSPRNMSRSPILTTPKPATEVRPAPFTSEIESDIEITDSPRTDIASFLSQFEAENKSPSLESPTHQPASEIGIDPLSAVMYTFNSPGNEEVSFVENFHVAPTDVAPPSSLIYSSDSPENENSSFIPNFQAGDPYPLADEDRSDNLDLLVLHRGKIFEELLEAFQVDYEINCLKIQMVLPNGQVERAEDMGGVFRDCLTEFWETFYDKCTVGTNLRVPELRHDFQESHWAAVGKILAKGWRNEKYLPIKLAPVFLRSCIGVTPKNEDLLKDFFNYLSETDAACIRNAMADFDSVDHDELIELLSNFDCKWIPRKDNFEKLIVDISYKELVQKPTFVSQSMQKHLSCFETEKLEDIYMNYDPNVKNILSRLEFRNPVHPTTAGYIKKFVKEADCDTRRNFLRFCTGSDIANRNITISFSSVDHVTNFARMPTAHTCTGLLELPTSYESYIMFRSEFKNLLNSNVWVMDII